MGKSIPSPGTKLQELAKILSSSSKSSRARHTKPPPVLKTQSDKPNTNPGKVRLKKTEPQPKPKPNMDINWEAQDRLPLSLVVSDCVKRWFQDTLKEARNGDVAMQVLVGQMYLSGYGVPVNAAKGRAWISKASRTRSSAWKGTMQVTRSLMIPKVVQNEIKTHFSKVCQCYECFLGCASFITLFPVNMKDKKLSSLIENIFPHQIV